ncbi:MAG: DNA polymerase III subunit gamma/tau [Candidatus Omnitrophica bacterium]|nr:DNA polymerase III subunit gamma/tau [Candidatus Omnitrophota bacterium]
MSYIVIARKWRPQKFDDVVGQEHITKSLRNSVLSGKLAQAYLFVGPRGVGKTSCARILAKSLNCKDAPTVTPCGECPACREISEGRSLDVIEIDGASNRGIDEIRALRENVKFAAVSGKYKIYIIDEVHMLTQEAFNALLKTLEEPPEHVKFIFATTQPAKILPTILSRCQKFEFSRIPVLKIIAKLEEIAKEEKISIDKEVLFDIAKISDGSMRDAESVMDQLASFSKNKIKPEDVVSVMGLIEQDSYFEFVEAIKNNDAQFCIDLISKLFTRGKNIAKFLEGLLWHLRNIMLSKVMKTNLEEMLDLPKEVTEKVIQQSKNLPMQELVNIFTEVIYTQDMAKKIGSYRIPLEVMVIKLTQKVPSGEKNPQESFVGSAAKVVANKIKLNNSGALFAAPKAKNKDAAADISAQAIVPEAKEPPHDDNTPAAGVQLSKEEAPEAPKASFDTLLNGWPKLVDAVSEKKMSVGTYLKDARPVELREGILTIGFSKRALFYKEAVEERHNQKLITDRINELFDTMLSLKFELLEDLENLSDAQDNKNSDSGPESEFLKSVLDTFNGRVFRKG